MMPPEPNIGFLFDVYLQCVDDEKLRRYLNSFCFHDIDTITSGDFIDTVVLNNKKECQSVVSVAKVNENK